MASFSGGDKLAARIVELKAHLDSAKSVRVGFLEGATYPDGQRVAEVAAYLEYGTKNMPPRPFFSQMVAAQKGQWGNRVARMLKANDYDTITALSLVGEGISKQLRRAIIDFTDPQDSDETKARKQSKHPDTATLVDTGHLLNSVDYEVTKK